MTKKLLGFYVVLACVLNGGALAVKGWQGIPINYVDLFSAFATGMAVGSFVLLRTSQKALGTAKATLENFATFDAFVVRQSSELSRENARLKARLEAIADFPSYGGMGDQMERLNWHAGAFLELRSMASNALGDNE